MTFSAAAIWLRFMSVTKGFPNGKKGSGTQLFSRDGDLSASALYRLVFLSWVAAQPEEDSLVTRLAPG